jgi:hypothetical protein
VRINDTYCAYEYTFKHKEEVSIHDIAKSIAKELECEVPAGKFIDLSTPNLIALRLYDNSNH